MGAEASFFELGGHSLLATQVTSRVRSVFGVELPVRAVFEAPTVKALAARIRVGKAIEGAPAIRPLPAEERRALSFAQARLWFLDQLDPGSPLYNLAAAVRLAGALDRGAFAAALGEIVRRHEVLRTTFRGEAGEPVAAVASPSGLSLPLIDLAALPAVAREEEAARLTTESARRPFDLAADSLLRAALLALAAEEHIALVTLHHIASDGWSIGVLTRELAALYAAFRAGAPSPLPELAIQYADYAAWQRRLLSGERLEAELAWWERELAGIPPALDLPTDRPRPAVRSPRGAVAGFALDGAALAAVDELSRRQGTTRFMTLLAGFAALLQRHAGADDVVVGTPIAGRLRAETEGLIGLFVNTLVLRTDLSGSPDLVTLLARVRETTLAAYAHQEVPFERLIERVTPERDLSRPPLVQVLFSLQNAPSGPLVLPDLALTVAEVATGTAKLELSCTLTEMAGGLSGVIEYSRDLFERATAERLADHFTRLLSGGVAEPRQRLAELPLLSPEEWKQLLVEHNDVGTLPASGATLHELFEAQVARTPEAVALVAGISGERWTYRELDLWAEELAVVLAALEVGPEVRVGVCLRRTPLLVASLLAVLKAGGSYVPLDPDYPAERLAFMLADSAAAVLVTEPELAASLPEHDVALLVVDPASRDRREMPAGRRPASGAVPGNLAYLIYTSGSTGRPKGVAIEHRSAVAFAQWARTVFPDADLAGVLASTSVSFDLSVFELFVTLAWGGKVVLAANALELPRLAALDEVVLLNTVPSAMAELVRQGAVPASVRTVNLAGEPLKRSLVEGIYAAPDASPNLRVLDLYGPSEDTTYSTWAPAEREERREPTIGRPIAGTRAFLLGRFGEVVPAGVPGELLLGGAGLARGYHDRPELTAERFVPDPFCGEAGGEPGGRLYRTGDLARYLPDGRLDYLGRLDHQVKVRGFRIELGEIEAALLAQPAVRAVSVLARPDASGSLALVAYVEAEPETVSAAGLRQALKGRLPEYMVPSAWAFLPALPQTANGKVDRKALAALPLAAPEAASAEAPRTPAEELVAGIFAEVLGLARVGAGDSFFELGGHSLLAMRALSRLREAFGVSLPVKALFEAPTVSALAAAVQAARGEAAPLAPSRLVRVPRDLPLPLSFAQARLWFLHQLEPASAAYNIPAAIHWTGGVDRAALAAALSEVARRHESLRTRFAVDPRQGGSPVQVIDGPAPVALPAIDLAGLPAELRRAEARRLARAEALRPFDLAAGPLLRSARLSLGGEAQVLLLTMHHVISDGWSLRLLARELGEIYGAFSAGLPSPLPELPIQYADLRGVAAELAGRARCWRAELAHWRARLADAPPVLDLPLDHPRTLSLSERGGSRELALPAALLPPLRELARRQGVTLFMAVLAAFQALLSRSSGHAEDVSVGTPVAGRNQLQTENLIGFFVNTLVLHTDLAGEPSFRGAAGAGAGDGAGGLRAPGAAVREAGRGAAARRATSASRRCSRFRSRSTPRRRRRCGWARPPGRSGRSRRRPRSSTSA